MIDLMLRADDEATLAAALPMLRDGGVWVTASHHHALDLIGPVEIAPATLDEAGGIVTPATLDERFHLNLRLRDDCPDCEAIQATAAPFVVTPGDPARVWA